MAVLASVSVQPTIKWNKYQHFCSNKILSLIHIPSHIPVPMIRTSVDNFKTLCYLQTTTGRFKKLKLKTKWEHFFVFSFNFFKRPGFGRVGQRIRVWVNHYRVALKHTGTVYHYDIKITPEVPRSMNRKIFQLVSIWSTSSESEVMISARGKSFWESRMGAFVRVYIALLR